MSWADHVVVYLSVFMYVSMDQRFVPSIRNIEKAKVLFTDGYTWQNFGLQFLGLVNRLYTVIHKTQKS